MLWVLKRTVSYTKQMTRKYIQLYSQNNFSGCFTLLSHVDYTCPLVYSSRWQLVIREREKLTDLATCSFAVWAWPQQAPNSPQQKPSLQGSRTSSLTSRTITSLIHAPITLCLQVLSAVNFCKQFGPISGPTERQFWSGVKMFDTLMVFLKGFFEKDYFEKNQQMTKKHAKLPSRWKDIIDSRLTMKINWIWFM